MVQNLPQTFAFFNFYVFHSTLLLVGVVVVVAWVTLACLFFTSSMGVFSFLGGQNSLEDGLGLTVFVSVYFCIYLFVYVAVFVCLNYRVEQSAVV